MPVSLFIDGAHVQPEGGHHDVIDPAAEEVVDRAPEASSSQVRTATGAARRASEAWAQVPVAERAQLVATMADHLSQRREELVTLIQAETGALTWLAEAQQFTMALSYLSKWTTLTERDFQQPLLPTAGPSARLTAAVVKRAPAGVVACITPFNFPLLTASAMVGPALVSGNTVVLKPAPANPLAVFALADAAQAAGLPPGVLNVIGGSSPQVGVDLVAARDVDMVSFTGSTAVGAQIAAAAGADMKRTLLELGGKGAVLVFEDADLDLAADGIATTWTRHSGQVCTAPTRVIAHRSVHDELVARLEARAAAQVIGAPDDPASTVGPLTTRSHLDRVAGYVESALAEGGTLVTPRPALPDRGFYHPPALLTGTDPSMRVVREEVFGPVVATMTFEDDDDAIAMSNASLYGLHDYLFSADTTRMFGLAQRLRTGYVSINTVGRSPEAPFGGFGASGIGRDGGRYSLEAFTEPQSIVWQT